MESGWERAEGEVMGALALLYSNDARGITSKPLAIQHERNENIVSTMHIHMDEHNRMEAIAIKGLPQEVTEVSDRLISYKGVKHGKLVTGSTGKDMG